MNYHDRLKSFIKSQGDSQIVAGQKIGYQKSAFSKYLSGAKNINLEFIQRLIQTYPNVDLNYIFKGEEVSLLVNEPPPSYNDETAEMIEDIENKLKLLKEKVTHK